MPIPPGEGSSKDSLPRPSKLLLGGEDTGRGGGNRLTEMICPNCGGSLDRAFEGKLEHLLKGRPVNCPNCQLEIRLDDKSRRDVQKSLDDFKRSLRRLGR